MDSAQEVAVVRGHKAISGADVLKALETLDFPDIADGLQGDYEGMWKAKGSYLLTHLVF